MSKGKNLSKIKGLIPRFELLVGYYIEQSKITLQIVE